MFNGNEELFEMDFIPTLSELLIDAICAGDTDDFYTVFALMESDEIKCNVDLFIETAIERRRPEFTIFLIDYKKTNNLYRPPSWEI